MNIRIDFVFSYWIFAWFLLYYFKLTRLNPLFALEIATIENTIVLLLMIYYKVPIFNIIGFLIINTFIKILPVIYLWKTKTKIRDVITTIILYIIYLIWLYINKEKNVFKVQHDIYKSLIHGKSETPFMSLLKNLKKYFVKES
jgi:hypothetical protein